jgi:hypothetical protein
MRCCRGRDPRGAFRFFHHNAVKKAILQRIIGEQASHGNDYLSLSRDESGVARSFGFADHRSFRFLKLLDLRIQWRVGALPQTLSVPKLADPVCGLPSDPPIACLDRLTVTMT